MKKLKVLDAGGDEAVNQSDDWGNYEWDQNEDKKQPEGLKRPKIDMKPYKKA